MYRIEARCLYGVVSFDIRPGLPSRSLGMDIARSAANSAVRCRLHATMQIRCLTPLRRSCKVSRQSYSYAIFGHILTNILASSATHKVTYGGSRCALMPAKTISVRLVPRHLQLLVVIQFSWRHPHHEFLALLAVSKTQDRLAQIGLQNSRRTGHFHIKPLQYHCNEKHGFALCDEMTWTHGLAATEGSPAWSSSKSAGSALEALGSKILYFLPEHRFIEMQETIGYQNLVALPHQPAADDSVARENSGRCRIGAQPQGFQPCILKCRATVMQVINVGDSALVECWCAFLPNERNKRRVAEEMVEQPEGSFAGVRTHSVMQTMISVDFNRFSQFALLYLHPINHHHEPRHVMITNTQGSALILDGLGKPGIPIAL